METRGRKSPRKNMRLIALKLCNNMTTVRHFGEHDNLGFKVLGKNHLLCIIQFDGNVIVSTTKCDDAKKVYDGIMRDTLNWTKTLNLTFLNVFEPAED